MDPVKYCMILTTCATDAEANRLAAGLIKEKLAACVQLSPIQSYYTWKGRTEITAEIRMVIKTQARRYGSVEKYIQTHHTYEVPQIIKIPILDGSPEYLAWMDLATDPGPDSHGSF